ncbi:MAG: hypothetical protein K9K34_19345 [Desulfarculaceae bacterium]|nr:hypothetical protein [Desulfarculaceae bacterium]
MSKKTFVRHYNDPHNPYKTTSKINPMDWIDIQKEGIWPWSKLERPLVWILQTKTFTRNEGIMFWFLFENTRGFLWMGKENVFREGFLMDRCSIKKITGLGYKEIRTALDGLYDKKVVYFFTTDGTTLDKVQRKTKGGGTINSLSLWNREERVIYGSINFRWDTWALDEEVKTLMDERMSKIYGKQENDLKPGTLGHPTIGENSENEELLKELEGLCPRVDSFGL